ncbi:MAG: hypothetical protein ABDH37_04280 [Candidatus Hydrothermales bacterium]
MKRFLIFFLLTFFNGTLKADWVEGSDTLTLYEVKENFFYFEEYMIPFKGDYTLPTLIQSKKFINRSNELEIKLPAKVYIKYLLNVTGEEDIKFHEIKIISFEYIKRL